MLNTFKKLFLVTTGMTSIVVLSGVTASSAALITNQLVLRLDASAGVTTDGSNNVTAWSDLSSSFHDASQSVSANQPLLVNGVLNGKPVVRFDGDNDYLDLAGAVLSSQQFTIIGVVNDTATDTIFREIFSNWTPTRTIDSVFFGTVNQGPRRARLTDDLGGATDAVNNQIGVGDIQNPSQHFIFTGLASADASVYQNQSLLASKGGAITTRDLGTPYLIGSQGGGEFWQGDIAELLVYNKALSTQELQDTWGYLQDKYFPTSTSTTPEPSALLGLGALGLSVLLERKLSGARWRK
jgi:hypothetical protein